MSNEPGPQKVTFKFPSRWCYNSYGSMSRNHNPSFCFHPRNFQNVLDADVFEGNVAKQEVKVFLSNTVMY